MAEVSANTTLRVFADGKLVAANVVSATRFLQRLVGLLRHRGLASGEGLLIDPGGSIHTLGMRFPIDVVFLDCNYMILGFRSSVAPFRACRAPRDTRSTLELWSGACRSLPIRPGQYLEFVANGDG